MKEVECQAYLRLHFPALSTAISVQSRECAANLKAVERRFGHKTFMMASQHARCAL